VLTPSDCLIPVLQPPTLKCPAHKDCLWLAIVSTLDLEAISQSYFFRSGNSRFGPLPRRPPFHLSYSLPLPPPPTFNPALSSFFFKNPIGKVPASSFPTFTTTRPPSENLFSSPEIPWPSRTLFFLSLIFLLSLSAQSSPPSGILPPPNLFSCAHRGPPFPRFFAFTNAPLAEIGNSFFPIPSPTPPPSFFMFLTETICPWNPFSHYAMSLHFSPSPVEPILCETLTRPQVPVDPRCA